MKTVQLTHKHVEDFDPVVMLVSTFETLSDEIKSNYEVKFL